MSVKKYEVRDVIRIPDYAIRIPDHEIVKSGKNRTWMVTGLHLGGVDQESTYSLIPLDKTENKPIHVPCLILETHPGVQLVEVCPVVNKGTEAEIRMSRKDLVTVLEVLRAHETVLADRIKNFKGVENSEDLEDLEWTKMKQEEMASLLQKFQEPLKRGEDSK